MSVKEVYLSSQKELDYLSAEIHVLIETQSLLSPTHDRQKWFYCVGLYDLSIAGVLLTVDGSRRAPSIEKQTEHRHQIKAIQCCG